MQTCLLKFLFGTEQFLFVLDTDATWDDDEIWKFAKENTLIIVTKDKDFM